MGGEMDVMYWVTHSGGSRLFRTLAEAELFAINAKNNCTVWEKCFMMKQWVKVEVFVYSNATK